jgi:hypothetical protein
MERYVGKHEKEPGHQTRDTASPVDNLRSPEDAVLSRGAAPAPAIVVEGSAAVSVRALATWCILIIPRGGS